MPKPTAPRRSQRLASRNKPQTATKKKERGISSSTTSSVDLDLLEAAITAHITKARKSVASKRTTRSSTTSKDSTNSNTYSEEDHDEEYDSRSPSSPAESIYSTIERIITHRQASHDSRYDSGNEDYELDDFVVDDDASISSDSDNDTIVAARSPSTTRSNTRSASALSTTHSSTSKTTRRSSTSTSSKLFFSDPEDSRKPLDMIAWLQLGITSDDPEDVGADLVTEPSMEIAEEISDAVAMFSRRCNKEKAPVRLRLASVVGRDEEIKEALDRAVEVGLGRMLVLSDSSVLWTIGPKFA
ncbi:hypothetical protein DM02DRAFT_660922 [Periconia macrospinosa]|uniref:Uncharacterized protein n=1 Tax=Periconia macrospinosa TaxID=97972 RepID=A0A2V1DBN3_9PLEO|nr:hypothetical protein DM02DRAFT_660922 [Periconia macrospinosa]